LYILVTAFEANVDLVLVLDVSLSIGNNTNFQTVIQFVSDVSQFLVFGLNDSLVRAILFAHHANVHFHESSFLDYQKIIIIYVHIIAT